MVRFCKPNNISRYDVMIKNHRGKGCRGTAYHKGSSYHATTSPFIVVSVQRDAKGYPRKTAATGAYIPFIVMSREENVLYILAHELRHLWQSKIKKGWRVWGSRGQFSERDADAYAIRKVREWRVSKNLC